MKTGVDSGDGFQSEAESVDDGDVGNRKQGQLSQVMEEPRPGGFERRLKITVRLQLNDQPHQHRAGGYRGEDDGLPRGNGRIVQETCGDLQHRGERPKQSTKACERHERRARKGWNAARSGGGRRRRRGIRPFGKWHTRQCRPGRPSRKEYGASGILPPAAAAPAARFLLCNTESLDRMIAAGHVMGECIINDHPMYQRAQRRFS